MLVYLLAASASYKWARKIMPFLDIIKVDDRAVLNKGLNKPAEIVIVDKVAEKMLAVKLSKTQTIAHRKFVSLTRKVVNTRLFELVTAKMMHDKWPGRASLGYQVNL